MEIIEEIFDKNRSRPIIGFSVYDYFGARLINEFKDIDFVLVGDSLSMVFKGKPTVKSVDMDEMIYHLRIVSETVRDKPIILDMPIGSYEDPEEAVENAYKALTNGAHGIMIEGIHIETMDRLKEEDIKFIVHLGYMPKYHDRPRIIKDYEKLLYESLTCQRHGAMAIKFEAVERNVTKMIRERLDIPLLGVGSGPWVDGHILVLYDFLGMYPDFKARFVKKYIDVYGLAREALKKLLEDIFRGKYPSEDESY